MAVHFEDMAQYKELTTRLSQLGFVPSDVDAGNACVYTSNFLNKEFLLSITCHPDVAPESKPTSDHYTLYITDIATPTKNLFKTGLSLENLIGLVKQSISSPAQTFNSGSCFTPLALFNN